MSNTSLLLTQGHRPNSSYTHKVKKVDTAKFEDPSAFIISFWLILEEVNNSKVGEPVAFSKIQLSNNFVIILGLNNKRKIFFKMENNRKKDILVSNSSLNLLSIVHVSLFFGD